MVTEQIANLSTRKCRLGSSPSLSAFALLIRQLAENGGHFKFQLGGLRRTFPLDIGL